RQDDNENRRWGDPARRCRADPEALGGHGRDDEPEGTAGDEGLLPPARGQAGGDDRGQHGLPARGGRGLSPRGGLPLLPVLEGKAGEQAEGRMTAGWLNRV